MAKFQLPTAPKLTCSRKFHLRKLTVSLLYTFSFSKNISLAFAVQLPFRTDSKPLRRRFVGKTGFDTCRRKFLQNCFRQSFESSPESRGRKPLVYFWFFSYKRKARKTSPSGEFRGFANLKSAHKDNTFIQTKLNPFEKFRGFPNLKTALHSHTSLICYSFTSNFKIRCKNKKTLLKYHHTENPYSPGLCYTYVTL